MKPQEFIDCLRCKKNIPKKNARQKYCTVCSNYAQRENDKLRKQNRDK